VRKAHCANYAAVSHGDASAGVVTKRGSWASAKAGLLTVSADDSP